MLFPCRSEPAPVRINWASLNANREQVEAEKWAGKVLLCFIFHTLRASWYLRVWVEQNSRSNYLVIAAVQ